MEQKPENFVLQSTAMEYRKRVCLAMDYISQNIERDISLEEIAGVACFSMFHFHRIFKAVVGETVAEFTRRLRLELAANRLISKKNEDITTIAIACGFSSSQNFAKAFHRHFRTTPSSYRKSKIGNKNSKKENAISLNIRYNSDISYVDFFKNSERIKSMDAQVKEMPAYHVAYVRKIGPYGKATCEQAFGELAQWAGPKGYLLPSKVFGVYWDSPEVTPPEKCRTDACVVVPEGTVTEGQIALQTIQAGLYMVCHFEMKEMDFRQAWENSFKWLIQQGYECDDRPSYELYHNCPEQDPQGRCIFDICIPLKRKS